MSIPAIERSAAIMTACGKALKLQRRDGVPRYVICWRDGTYSITTWQPTSRDFEWYDACGLRYSERPGKDDANG